VSDEDDCIAFSNNTTIFNDDVFDNSEGVKSQIWEEAIARRDGEIQLKETCTSIKDCDKVIKAMDEMVQEG
jgi:hypothetical protein